LYLRRLRTIRMKAELRAAHDTQMSIMPHENPIVPGCDISGICIPANEVGGDFFDYFLVSPGTLVFVIADVSGKGLSAALVMAVTRTMVRDLAQSGRRPGEILRETNERLRESRRSGAFVTLFLGIYHSASGQVTYANGGHLPPYLISSTGEVATVGEATGTIVGMLEQQDYQDAEFTLQPGDTLLLHTDGYPEARSPAGEFYGTSRIKHFLQRHARGSVRELCDAITAEIAAFQHDSLSDDLTLLALRRSVRSVNVA
ncbi:MAG: PP2C family protein-serine/threonine phosphatase, partial [Pseudohongiellaceae bacterium]